MNVSTELLRTIPQTSQLLTVCREDAGLRDCNHQELVIWIREATDAFRRNVLSGAIDEQTNAKQWILQRVGQLFDAETGCGIQPVINATGILLHTNLGRAPIAQRACQRMEQATGFANVELDLSTGRRSRRGQRCNRLLAMATGAQDAVVVNNCAAATLLVLQCVASGREVVISRGQLVEIGGGFRLPDVFRASGALLHEVGTTNRTYLRDYQQAAGEATGAILRVHRSNFAQSGFVTEPSIDELVQAFADSETPVIDDLGSGCMMDLSDLGLEEPAVPDSVQAGADLILFSGDKLFGGPQCGIIVGKSHWISQVRSHPLMRAMRCDKTTLAGVEATAEIHLAGTAQQEIPLLQMMYVETTVLMDRCEAIARDLGNPEGFQLEVCPCVSPIGGGSIPGATLPSWALRISGEHVDRIAQQLRKPMYRQGTSQSTLPAVQPRIADDSVWLDLRTVAPSDLPSLTARLQAVLQN